MPPENDNPERDNEEFSPSEYLGQLDKLIRPVTLRAMAAGNDGDFETALLNMELALWISKSLGKTCTEAALLNNLGLLYTMQGFWDKAMLTFDRSMEIALGSCHSQEDFLSTLSKNISTLFDPKIATPGDPV